MRHSSYLTVNFDLNSAICFSLFFVPFFSNVLAISNNSCAFATIFGKSFLNFDTKGFIESSFDSSAGIFLANNSNRVMISSMSFELTTLESVPTIVFVFRFQRKNGKSQSQSSSLSASSFPIIEFCIIKIYIGMASAVGALSSEISSLQSIRIQMYVKCFSNENLYMNLLEMCPNDMKISNRHISQK